MTDHDPQFSFAHRLRLAMWWNFRLGVLRAQAGDAVIDLCEAVVYLVLMFLLAIKSVVKLALLPLWVYVFDPFFVAARVRGSGPGALAWRDVQRVYERRNAAPPGGGSE